MGLAHGGMRQKNFNFYEEATRVPLVYSNPKLFPKPRPDRRARLPRRLPADPGQPRRRRRRAPAPTGRGSTTPTLVLRPATPNAGPGLRRLHLRRLPVRPGERALPETAEPHRQHPRRALEAGQVLRRRTAQSRPPQWEMYDLKTDPLENDEPRLQGLRTHPRAGEAVPAAQTEARPGREDPPAAAVAHFRIGGSGSARDASSSAAIAGASTRSTKTATQTAIPTSAGADQVGEVVARVERREMRGAAGEQAVGPLGRRASPARPGRSRRPPACWC